MSPDTHDTPERGVAPLEHTKPENRETRESQTGQVELRVRSGSITLRPGVRERQASDGDAKAGRAFDGHVDAAAKVGGPFILGAAWSRWRRPRPCWSASMGRKSMSTFTSTVSGTDLTSSALLEDHDVVSARTHPVNCN